MFIIEQVVVTLVKSDEFKVRVGNNVKAQPVSKEVRRTVTVSSYMMFPIIMLSSSILVLWFFIILWHFFKISLYYKPHCKLDYLTHTIIQYMLFNMSKIRNKHLETHCSIARIISCELLKFNELILLVTDLGESENLGPLLFYRLKCIGSCFKWLLLFTKTKWSLNG